MKTPLKPVEELRATTPKELTCKQYSYEYVFLCRVPDSDHRWELRPSHSEVSATTLEFGNELVRRYNESNKLTTHLSRYEALQRAAETGYAQMINLYNELLNVSPVYAIGIKARTQEELKKYQQALAALADGGSK